MPTIMGQPAWQTYTSELAMLGHGLALWEPAPLYNYDKVAIGDVGYIRQGCFHLLFNAATPLGDRVLGVDVPRNFVKLNPGPTIQYQPRMPGALHNGNIVEKSAGFGASSDISFIQAGTNLRFESSHSSGAILLTKFKTFREDVERLGYLRDYIACNYQCWLDYANQLGHMVNLEDIILVTGHDMTLDFAMLAFSSNSRQLGMEFEAIFPGVASGSASVWGTWRTTTSVHHNCGPQHREPPPHNSGSLLNEESAPTSDSQADYNQCVFVRGFRMRKRAGLFPTVIKAAAGPHDLGSGHRFDEEGSLVLSEGPESSDYEVVPISDTPSFVDPLDPIFSYIFENSSAEIAILNDLDMKDLMKNTCTKQVNTQDLVSRLTPDMIEIGPDGSARLNIPRSSFPTPSSQSYSLTKVPSSYPSMSHLVGSTSLEEQVQSLWTLSLSPRCQSHTPTTSMNSENHVPQGLYETRVLEERGAILRASMKPQSCAECRRPKPPSDRIFLLCASCGTRTDPRVIYGSPLTTAIRLTTEFLSQHPKVSEISDLFLSGTRSTIAEASSGRIVIPLALEERKFTVMENIRSWLPPWKKAWLLCDIYFENAAWLCHPIRQDHFMMEIFGPMYHHSLPQFNKPSDQKLPRLLLQELALLLMVFSLATLLDLNLPPNNIEAEFYYRVASAIISSESNMVEPTIPAIQTLLLMSFYHCLGNRKHGESVSQTAMSMAIEMSQRLGLLRDSETGPLLYEKTVEQQRLLVWELYTLDLTQVLTFCRPAAWPLTTINRNMPASSVQDASSRGALDPSFHFIKYHYFSVYVAPIVHFTRSADDSSYSTALALDCGIRDQEVSRLIEFDPSHAPGDPILDLTSPSMGRTMQKFMLGMWPHLTLIYLHRGYFVQALQDFQPAGDLLEGRYAPSVLAIFRSSSVILALLQALGQVKGELAKRFWMYWYHGLAAAIVVGSIVAKAPGCPLARPALEQINAACTIFKCAAQTLPQNFGGPGKALAVVMRLRHRANQAAWVHACKHGDSTLSTGLKVTTNQYIYTGNMDFGTGGEEQAPQSYTQSQSLPVSPGGIQDDQNGVMSETLENVHPSLLADLRKTKQEAPSYVPQGVNSHSIAGGYLPAADPDTQVSFGLPDNPDWEVQWHSLMDQYGMLV